MKLEETEKRPARPIGPEEAADLLRQLLAKRDLFDPHSVPWSRFDAIREAIEKAQDRTEVATDQT